MYICSVFIAPILDCLRAHFKIWLSVLNVFLFIHCCKMLYVQLSLFSFTEYYKFLAVSKLLSPFDIQDHSQNGMSRLLE